MNCFKFFALFCCLSFTLSVGCGDGQKSAVIDITPDQLEELDKAARAQNDSQKELEQKQIEMEMAAAKAAR